MNEKELLKAKNGEIVTVLGYESTAITYNNKTNRYVALTLNDSGDYEELGEYKDIEIALYNLEEWVNR